MKTDTDDTIRVTVTFRRESNQEWYDRLILVRSGRARAEIVRSALALPRPRTASSPPTQTATKSTEAKVSESLTVHELTPVKNSVSKTEPIVNSSNESTAVGGLLTPFEPEKNLEKQSVENNTVNNSTTKRIRRSGMADGILGAGEVTEGGF